MPKTIQALPGRLYEKQIRCKLRKLLLPVLRFKLKERTFWLIRVGSKTRP